MALLLVITSCGSGSSESEFADWRHDRAASLLIQTYVDEAEFGVSLEALGVQWERLGPPIGRVKAESELSERRLKLSTALSAALDRMPSELRLAWAEYLTDVHALPDTTPSQAQTGKIALTVLVANDPVLIAIFDEMVDEETGPHDIELFDLTGEGAKLQVIEGLIIQGIDRAAADVLRLNGVDE